MRRVVGLKVQNVMRLKAADITVGDQPMVTVSGKNKSGKTSLLRSMVMAIGGARSIPDEPIKRGAAKGSVDLNLGDLHIALTMRKGKKPSLTITGEDGEKLRAPQTLLDMLRAHQTLDVRRFSEMTGTERIAVVKGLTGLDFENHDANRQTVYEQRAVFNREVKRLEGAIGSAERHDGVPDEPVSVAELSTRLEGFMLDVGRNAAAREKLDRQRTMAVEQKQAVARLKDRLEEEEARLEELVQIGTAMAAEVAELADPDTEGMRAKIATAEETNAKVRANLEHTKLCHELDAAKTRAAEKTEYLEQMDAAKAQAIADAKYPVEGLTVGETDVMLDGFDFGQASGAERLVAAAAIEAALHPELRVVFIDEGANLDADSRAGLERWASENDVQVWLALAGDQPASVVIEDGEVVDAEKREEPS